MVNGNDYIEIEEEHYEQITEAYAEAILNGCIEVPSDYIIKWIEAFNCDGLNNINLEDDLRKL